MGHSKGDTPLQFVPGYGPVLITGVAGEPPLKNGIKGRAVAAPLGIPED